MLFRFEYVRGVYLALLVLAIIMVVGTLGYRFLEDDFTFIDAFYMTVITISTVGFSEVHELSDSGRLFTAFLIMTSFGTFAYAVTAITRYFVSGEYQNYLRNIKVNRKIEDLSGHVIVCGYGRNGKQAVRTLKAYHQKIVVLEGNEELVNKERRSRDDILWILGDATNEDHVIRAGVHRAKALITTLPKDSDNLFVVLTARELNKKLMIISRASQDNTDKKLRIAGADNVIMPDKVGGTHMASLVTSPDVIEFLDQIAVHGEDEVNLEEVDLDEFASADGLGTIRDLETRNRTGITILGIKTVDGKFVVNPSPDHQLASGAKLFVLGNPNQMELLKDILRG